MEFKGYIHPVQPVRSCLRQPASETTKSWPQGERGEDPAPRRSAGSSPGSVLNSCRTGTTMALIPGAGAEERGSKLGEAALRELLTPGDEVKELELGLFATSSSTDLFEEVAVGRRESGAQLWGRRLKEKEGR